MQQYLDKLKTFSFRGTTVPEHMHQQIAEYLQYGIVPCDFLVGIIKKDLGACVDHADDANIPLIATYYAFFYNHAPSTAWGSDKWFVIQQTSYQKEREAYFEELRSRPADHFEKTFTQEFPIFPTSENNSPQLEETPEVSPKNNLTRILNVFKP